VKLALDRGEAGPLLGPSAYYMKTPPRQLRDSIALEACSAFIEGRDYQVSDVGDQMSELKRSNLSSDI
jgi:myo-inositol-1-phosphate synthase